MISLNNKVLRAMERANVFAIDGKDLIVMDISKRHNPKLFEQGCNLIYKKITNDTKRQRFISVLLRYYADCAGEFFYTDEYNNFIAFICEIALYNNRKLRNPYLFHSSFEEYVARVFVHYNLEEVFDTYKMMNMFVLPNEYKYDHSDPNLLMLTDIN